MSRLREKLKRQGKVLLNQLVLLAALDPGDDMSTVQAEGSAS